MILVLGRVVFHPRKVRWIVGRDFLVKGLNRKDDYGF